MKPEKVGPESLELLMIHPVYKTKTRKITGTGEVESYQILHKELMVRKIMQMSDISSVEEYVLDGGVVAKDRSVIFDKQSSKFYAVKHSYDDMSQAKYGKNDDKIGFNGRNIQSRKS